MNSYKEMRERHQKEFNELPLGFAFDEAGFERMMKKWGLKPTDTDKILRIPCGGFIRKEDEKHIDEVLKRQDREMKEAIAADKDGSGFIFEMFRYELLNHEYGYVYYEAVEQTLDCLGYSEDDLEKDERLENGFKLACRSIKQEID